MDEETWFEVEYSRKGSDDWYLSSRHDTFEAASKLHLSFDKTKAEFDLRVVRVELSRKVIASL